MKMKLLFFIIFIIFFKVNLSAQKRVVSISTKDTTLKKLFSLKDSASKEHLMIISQIVIRYKLNAIINSLILKDKVYINPTDFIELPEYLYNAEILDVSWRTGFAYLDPQSTKPHVRNFSIYKYVDSVKVDSEQTQLEVHSSGGSAIHFINEKIAYYNSNANKSIQCSIKSKPIGVDADIYAITEDDWENVYHFPSPPLNQVITKNIVDRLYFNKIGNALAEITTNLTDEPWIIIFDHKGIYTTAPLIPSKNNHIEYPIR